jgi:hypothetical protein
MSTTIFTAQTREYLRVASFATLADAIKFGLSLNEPFDVSVSSGAIVWAWDQRP